MVGSSGLVLFGGSEANGGTTIGSAVVAHINSFRIETDANDVLSLFPLPLSTTVHGLTLEKHLTRCPVVKKKEKHHLTCSRVLLILS